MARTPCRLTHYQPMSTPCHRQTDTMEVEPVG